VSGNHGANRLSQRTEFQSTHMLNYTLCHPVHASTDPGRFWWSILCKGISIPMPFPARMLIPISLGLGGTAFIPAHTELLFFARRELKNAPIMTSGEQLPPTLVSMSTTSSRSSPANNSRQEPLSSEVHISRERQLAKSLQWSWNLTHL
jgi:hypothetical protein